MPSGYPDAEADHEQDGDDAHDGPGHAAVSSIPDQRGVSTPRCTVTAGGCLVARLAVTASIGALSVRGPSLGGGVPRRATRRTGLGVNRPSAEDCQPENGQKGSQHEPGLHRSTA